MADSKSGNNDKREKNAYESNVNKWVIWAAIAIIIFVILLLVLNRRSVVINPEGESDSHLGLLMTHSNDQTSDYFKY